MAAYGVGPAAAQSPAPLPAAVTTPAPATGWRDWPTNPAPAAGTAERTMTFRKPAGAEVSQILPVDDRPQIPVPQGSARATTQPPAAKPPSSATTPAGDEPKKSEVFRLDSDTAIDVRIKNFVPRQDFKFPDLPDLTMGKNYPPRSYPPSKVELEPGYIVHRRLLFEEKNAERYGWELGATQPFVSAAYFYRDCLFLPYKVASNVCERYDTSAGKCLPGSPVPYYVYPPDFSWTGTVAELGVATGLVFIFP